MQVSGRDDGDLSGTASLALDADGRGQTAGLELRRVFGKLLLAARTSLDPPPASDRL